MSSASVAGVAAAGSPSAQQNKSKYKNIFPSAFSLSDSLHQLLNTTRARHTNSQIKYTITSNINNTTRTTSTAEVDQSGLGGAILDAIDSITSAQRVHRTRNSIHNNQNNESNATNRNSSTTSNNNRNTSAERVARSPTLTDTTGSSTTGGGAPRVGRRQISTNSSTSTIWQQQQQPGSPTGGVHNIIPDAAATHISPTLNSTTASTTASTTTSAAARGVGPVGIPSPNSPIRSPQLRRGVTQRQISVGSVSVSAADVLLHSTSPIYTYSPMGSPSGATATSSSSTAPFDSFLLPSPMMGPSARRDRSHLSTDVPLPPSSSLSPSHPPITFAPVTQIQWSTLGSPTAGSADPRPLSLTRQRSGVGQGQPHTKNNHSK